MQRFIGGILVIAATSGAGILYGIEQQNYMEKLLYMRHVIYMIKSELEYGHSPIGEICGRVGERIKEPYKKWLFAIEKQIQSRTEGDFLKIWMRSIDRYLADLNLKPTHSVQLKELGCYIGQMNTAAESRNLQLYLERLELEIEKVRDGITAKKRIGSCLGVMGGIFLVVVLM